MSLRKKSYKIEWGFLFYLQINIMKNMKNSKINIKNIILRTFMFRKENKLFLSRKKKWFYRIDHIRFIAYEDKLLNLQDYVYHHNEKLQYGQKKLNQIIDTS